MTLARFHIAHRPYLIANSLFDVMTCCQQRQPLPNVVRAIECYRGSLNDLLIFQLTV